MPRHRFTGALHAQPQRAATRLHLHTLAPTHPPTHPPSAGLWDEKPVQCASGDYLAGDYAGWKAWRDALPTVEHI